MSPFPRIIIVISVMCVGVVTLSLPYIHSHMNLLPSIAWPYCGHVHITSIQSQGLWDKGINGYNAYEAHTSRNRFGSVNISRGVPTVAGSVPVPRAVNSDQGRDSRASPEGPGPS